MTYSLYDKPYRRPEELINDLKLKGLGGLTGNEPMKVLNDINYYRFKAYLVPYFDADTGKFRPETSFLDALDLYRFDDELRGLLFSLIGRVEVKLRTRLDQVICAHSNDPFWYLDDQFFSKNIDSFRSRLSKAFQDSKVEFSNPYKAQYINDSHHNYKHLPPFWILSELMTFGNVRMLYASLKILPFKGMGNENALHSMAVRFGAKNLGELNTWLNLINDVRNRCAHHSRVWNSNYRAPKGVIQLLSNDFKPTQNNRIYLLVVLLHKMSNELGADFQVKAKLRSLFAKYPAADKLKSASGFSEYWHNDPFWAVEN